jgi:siderophore synthetase component
MLEEWLKTLEREKQKAVQIVQKATNDEELIKVALTEIALNEFSAKNHLKEINEGEYRLNDDLTSIEEEYLSCEHYRFLYHHFSHHFNNIKNIPTSVEERDFKSELQTNIPLKYARDDFI